MTEVEYSMEKSKKQIRDMHIDPRTKMLILILVNLSLIFCNGLKEEFILECTILLFGIFQKKYKFIGRMFVIYLILLFTQIIGSQYLTGVFNVMIVTFAVFIRKLLPCGMIGGIIVSTTRVNEFMAAMNKIHMSRSITIPFAIMLRYFPMIKEDYNAIKDAMKMRDISPNIIGFIKNPIITIECIYVPIMMEAAKIADELSAAAITRGIENPNPRTCMQIIHYNIWDYIGIAYFGVIFILCVLF
ncbi:MAG TPA: energy-coupling factor transporter transmembrane protein EcfT [Clostridium sp.]|nr:energy-coupling factor transporter transmembrane protein EcfT [Clostridium sp.]